MRPLFGTFASPVLSFTQVDTRWGVWAEEEGEAEEQKFHEGRGDAGGVYRYNMGGDRIRRRGGVIKKNIAEGEEVFDNLGRLSRQTYYPSLEEEILES